MWGMEAGRFFRFARRLPAYKGAMRARAERLARDEEQRKEAQGLAGKRLVPVAAGELHTVLPGATAEGWTTYD
jgi:hypothetical protein